MEARNPAKPLRPKRRVTEVALGAHANAGLRAHVSACRLSRKLVRKPKVCRPTALQHHRAMSSCEITPFSIRFLRRFHCRFYARHPWRGAYSATGSPNCPDSGTRFPPKTQKESASHSEHQFRSALRYPRSHISTNEISLASPLLAAASWHPCVKPRFSSIQLRTCVRYSYI